MKSLIKVTSKARLGLILVSELAALGDGERLSLEEVAHKAGVSRKFLEQVAGVFRRAGIVKSQRGAAGGYRLARKPSEITIAEVLAAIDGPADFDDCTAHAKARPGRLPILEKIQGQVMASLMNTTVADMAG